MKRGLEITAPSRRDCLRDVRMPGRTETRLFVLLLHAFFETLKRLLG